MANTVADDWDETSPALNQPRRAGAAEILALRKAVRTRLLKEHVEPDAAGVGGEHIMGSGMIYSQSAAPTTKPDGVTLLDTDDIGRLWVDTDVNILYRWSGSAWVEITPTPTLSSFHKETALANSVGNPTVLPFTQSGLAAGTWLVWIYGSGDDDAANASYYLNATINGVTQGIFVDNHPDGTPPYTIPFLVTVTGAGTISVTAEQHIYRVQGMTGIRLAP